MNAMKKKYDFDNLPEGVSIGDTQDRTYQPPPKEQMYIDDPLQLNLCYAIMTHETPDTTIRLIEALYEIGHIFVIHVDGKETSDVEPGKDAWHYFVECDDAVHRIYRLPPLNEYNFGGIDMYTASQ